jgi:hypothetical protein
MLILIWDVIDEITLNNVPLRITRDSSQAKISQMSPDSAPYYWNNQYSLAYALCTCCQQYSYNFRKHKKEQYGAVTFW